MDGPPRVGRRCPKVNECGEWAVGGRERGGAQGWVSVWGLGMHSVRGVAGRDEVHIAE